MSLWTRLKCRLGFHAGHIECLGGWCFHVCMRCGRLTKPIPPERTAGLYLAMARKKEEAGLDASHERETAAELVEMSEADEPRLEPVVNLQEWR